MAVYIVWFLFGFYYYSDITTMLFFHGHSKEKKILMFDRLVPYQ